jgi:hypothetical protein
MRDVRGTYQENGDVDLTALPSSQGNRNQTFYFKAHLSSGASSFDGTVRVVQSGVDSLAHFL